VFSKDAVALAQVIETRRIVEVGNVRLAANRITPDELGTLDVLVADLRTALGDADRFAGLDIAVHDTVAAAAGNFLLAQFMRIINTLAKVSRERTGATRATREHALADIVAIVDALRAHDADASALAMEAHLDHVEAALASATSPTSPAQATSPKARK
jgi:GntR family transcriptional regulator, transcriptional repressor for pyruvate dehydrogenase complex